MSRKRRRLVTRLVHWLAVHFLGGLVLRMLMSSWRITFEGKDAWDRCHEDGSGNIGICWHQRLLPMAAAFRNQGICVLISQHRDGELIARVLHKHGYQTARGSSTRGGSKALRELQKTIGTTAVAITPDGPRGPRFCMKPGAAFLAATSARPVFHVSCGVSRFWQLGSWDRFMVPKPFARIHVRMCGPVFVSHGNETQATAEIETAFRAATAELDHRLGQAIDPSLETTGPPR